MGTENRVKLRMAKAALESARDELTIACVDLATAEGHRDAWQQKYGIKQALSEEIITDYTALLDEWKQRKQAENKQKLHKTTSSPWLLLLAFLLGGWTRFGAGIYGLSLWVEDLRHEAETPSLGEEQRGWLQKIQEQETALAHIHPDASIASIPGLHQTIARLEATITRLETEVIARTAEEDEAARHQDQQPRRPRRPHDH